MYVLLWLWSVSLVLVGLFYLLGAVLSLSDESSTKMSAFECGFYNSGMIHVSYSIHFFIMMMMFIFFDLEVVLFLSVVVSSECSLLSYMILFIFMMLSFYVEWWYGKLIWLV